MVVSGLISRSCTTSQSVRCVLLPRRGSLGPEHGAWRAVAALMSPVPDGAVAVSHQALVRQRLSPARRRWPDRMAGDGCAPGPEGALALAAEAGALRAANLAFLKRMMCGL